MLNIAVGLPLVAASNFEQEFREDFTGGAWDFVNTWRSDLPWRNNGLSWGGSNDTFFNINNNEHQRYVDVDNLPPSGTNPFSVINGHGRITATEVTSQDQAYAIGRVDENAADKPLSYLSGIARTREYTHHEGRIETVVRMPRGTGTFPAFWSFPSFPYASWLAVASGIQNEIDVFEYLGAVLRDYNIAVHDNEEGLTSVRTRDANFQGTVDLTADFHTFTCDWDSSHIGIGMDGVYDFVIPTPADFLDPTRRRQLIINLAMFGNYHDGIMAALARLNITPEPLALPANLDIQSITSSAGKWTLTTDKTTHILAATRPDGGVFRRPAGRVVIPA